MADGTTRSRKKPAEKTRPVGFRMTPEDYDLLEQAAISSKRSVSDYSRLALVEYVKQDLGIEDDPTQRKPISHPLRKSA